ncbi:L-alanyl-D-glutamate peptidase [Parabacteroides phage PF672P1]|nr:L-alanyl-D-glutamate peptidase [Parabacteroides phage PF672P1]
MANFSTRSLNNLKGIHPDLVKVMNEAIKDSPVDFTITNGVRTVSEQAALYAQGRTKPGKIVTHVDGVNKKSNHQIRPDGYGYAVDLYPFKNGSVQVNDADGLKVIAAHIKKVANKLGVNVQWGGDWISFKDFPHFELKK